MMDLWRVRQANIRKDTVYLKLLKRETKLTMHDHYIGFNLEMIRTTEELIKYGGRIIQSLQTHIAQRQAK